MGRPCITSSYAPGFTETTGSANLAVIGDFSRFVLPVRFGSFVEPIQQMFDFSGGTGRLTGQRGFYFYARWGCAPVTLDAFRLLANS